MQIQLPTPVQIVKTINYRATAFLFACICFGLILLFFLRTADADDLNGAFAAQQKPGIALIKPQAWSTAIDATPLEFTALINRTVSNTPGAGYYEFQDKLGNKRQIPASRVMVLYIYPNLSTVTTIASAEDRQVLQNWADSAAKLESRYPSLQPYIEKSNKGIADTLQAYDSGQMKIDGRWISKDTYAKEKAADLTKSLLHDVQAAKQISQFNLSGDSRFIALQQFAIEYPDIQPSVEKISTLYNRLLRVETRAKILAQLSNPNLSHAEIEKLALQLTTLNPEEDAKIVAYLKIFDASKEFNKKIENVRATFDHATLTITGSTPNPVLPDPVTSGAIAIGKEMQSYKAASPVLQLPMDMDVAQALGQLGNGFTILAKQFPLRQFYDAKISIDEMAPAASLVGANTIAAIAALQDFTARKIQKFVDLRNEARLFVKSGDLKQALAKFQDAYAIMPDPSVGKEIESVKTNMPQNSP